MGIGPDTGFWLSVAGYVVLLVAAAASASDEPPAGPLRSTALDPWLLIGAAATAGLLIAAAVSDSYTATDGIDSITEGRLIGGDAPYEGPFTLYLGAVALVLLSYAWLRPRAVAAVGFIGTAWPMATLVVLIFLLEGDLEEFDVTVTFEIGHWLRVAALAVAAATALTVASLGDADDEELVVHHDPASAA